MAEPIRNRLAMITSPVLAAIIALGCESGAGPGAPGNQAPAAQITAPAGGASVAESLAVSFTGAATDPEDGALTGAALTWSSSVDGTLGTGAALTVPYLSPGNHQIRLRATDSEGATADAVISLTVVPANPAPTLGLAPVASGLSEPVYLTHAPQDPGRLFVVEKTGAIRIIANGILLPRPFLDLSDSVSTGSEQGLLGLAFPADYAATGRFYVSYTRKSGDSRLARYRVSTTDPDSADPATGQMLLGVSQPASNHNGGMIAFGPDGYLYYGLGDGGGGGDPLLTGQDPTDLLGSILRLDVSGPGGYTIPPTNPFATSATNRHEVWNYGLRNPWRFSFDRQTGDLYIGDVGQGQHEEIDVQPAAGGGGENYGWNVMEGLSCYNTTSCNQAGLTLPVLDYDHGSACSVTGGYVYRGSAIPSLQGHYLYADYCAGFVRSFRWVGGQAVDRQSRATLSPGPFITSFGEDSDGELYLMTQGGDLYRIVPN